MHRVYTISQLAIQPIDFPITVHITGNEELHAVRVKRR